MITSLEDISSIPSIARCVNTKDIPCIRVIIMKKLEFISFRTDKETKDALIEIAASKKWSVSLLVEDIIQQWLKEQKEQKS